MTQFVTIDRATLEQLVVALNNAEAALNNSQALIAGRERFGFAKTCYGVNEIALGFVSPAITAGRAALANAEPTGWIAAKDRMPPPQVRVLGFEPQYNIVDVDMWFGPDFNWGYSYWMPLPAAPKATP